MLVQKALMVLMKFQNKDKLNMLQKGIMYMKPLQFYIDLEKKSFIKFVADNLEAKARTVVQNMKIIEREKNSIFIEAPIAKTTLSLGYENQPVFCMFSFDMRNCQNEMVNGNKLEYRMAFSEAQKEKLKSFGDSVLVIKNNYEFFNKVKKAFDKRNIAFERNHVTYYKEDAAVHLKNVIDGTSHIAFSKREEYFALQQEYRFLANIAIDNELILNIGNIEDISELYPVEEVLNNEYQAIMTLVD